jgi:alanine dehydrogenase
VTITIGFPRMRHEAGERRVFLPALLTRLARRGAQVVVEEAYGSEIGLAAADSEVAANMRRSSSCE